jgi:hypothetical protein
MGIYNKLRVYKEWLEHIMCENIQNWFKLMAENAEEPVV